MVDRKRKPTRRKTAVKKAKQGESRHPRPKPLPKPLAAAVERLRAICLALPEATRRSRASHVARRQIFAQMDTFHHGAMRRRPAPARPGVQADLVEENLTQFFVALRRPKGCLACASTGSVEGRGWPRRGRVREVAAPIVDRSTSIDV
jgi:hypothetical protein